MIDLIIFLSLLALGYGAGSWAEKRHYRSIAERENATINLPAESEPVRAARHDGPVFPDKNDEIAAP